MNAQPIGAHFNFVQDVLGHWARTRPDARALWWVDEHMSSQRLFSFSDLETLSRQSAHFFQELGVQRGDRVLVMLQRIPQWWIAVLGLVRMGAIVIPATPLLTAKDLRYRFAIAEVSAVLTDDAGAAKADGFEGLRILVGSPHVGWVDFDAGVAAASPTYQTPPTGADDPCFIYFTSGTTGDAKMVLHTQVSVGMGHRTTGQYWLDLHERDVLWTLADTGWGKTGWSALFGPWQMGACVFTVDMVGKFEPNTVLQILSTYPVSVFCAPSTALKLLVRKDLKRHRFEHLRHCVSAGESLHAPVLEAWRSGTGLTIYEAYGQTETVVLVGNFRSLGHPVRPGSMGRAAPGTEIAIVDAQGHELPPMQEGHLAVRVKPHRPLGMFAEYWKQPQETADRFVGDWYLTGDVARRDADGYFWFVGRSDDVINSASYRIGPTEVESALLEHPAVLECAAVGVPDEMRGELVKAYIVLREGFEASETMKHELQAHCKKVTAPYKYPRQIEFIAEMPKTPSGKIRRVALRQMHLRDHGTAGHGHQKPQSPSAPPQNGEDANRTAGD